MAGKPPPKFVIPPATSKTQKAFQTFVAQWAPKYPGLKQWAPQIVQFAAENHIDPIYYASVLMTESRVNAATGDSSAGAIGLGQVMPSHVGEYVPWDKTRTTRVTLADLRSPAFNLRFSAYLLGQAVGAYGYGGAYNQGYNPGWTPASGGIDPLSRIPHGYLPGVSSAGTAGATGAGTTTGAAATTTATDRWVVVTPKGVVKVVTAATPPANAAKDASGQAYNISSWQQVSRGLDTIYLAYAGRRASPREILGYIKDPVSDYQIQQRLSNPQINPGFYKSPIWQTHAPEYEAVYKSVFGNNADTNSPEARTAITNGVVHNLSSSGFQQILRDSPNYNTSEEYKAAAAQYHSSYAQIYGEPDAVGLQRIDQAVRQGINGDQWQQYLRAQPEYTTSGEFQRNIYSLARSMALVPGAQNALGSTAAPATVPQIPGGVSG